MRESGSYLACQLICYYSTLVQCFFCVFIFSYCVFFSTSFGLSAPWFIVSFSIKPQAHALFANLCWYQFWVSRFYLFCNIGGNGYINDYPTGRFLRDAKLYEIGAGTSEVRRMVIGRALNNEYMSLPLKL